MPAFWVFHTPFVKMHHKLCANDIQKLSEGLARMIAPLPEASTLTMPYYKGIHEEHHIPMTTNRLIIYTSPHCQDKKSGLLRWKPDNFDVAVFPSY